MIIINGHVFLCSWCYAEVLVLFCSIHPSSHLSIHPSVQIISAQANPTRHFIHSINVSVTTLRFLSGFITSYHVDKLCLIQSMATLKPPVSAILWSKSQCSPLVQEKRTFLFVSAKILLAPGKSHSHPYVHCTFLFGIYRAVKNQHFHVLAMFPGYLYWYLWTKFFLCSSPTANLFKLYS